MVSILVINSYNAQDYNLVSLFIIYSFGEERATYNIGDVYNRCYTQTTKFNKAQANQKPTKEIV